MCPVSVATSSQSKYALKAGSAKLWIILVGVNKYLDNSLPCLQYPALDCQGLSEALADATQTFPQKEIIIHHDFAPELPTLEIVRNSLNQTLSAANPQDTVLFYFSGHGLLDAHSQQAILCLKNTQKQDPLNTGLSLQELLQLLDNCNARQQLVWLDACHSGSMMLGGVNRKIEPGKNNYSSLLNPSSQLVEVLQKRAAQSQGFYALLSCDRNQRSWEFPELGHGVFTYYLMRGLCGEAADAQGVIDADGLYKYVYHQTLQYIDKTNQQLRLINQQKRSRGENQLHPEYSLQTPKRIVEGVGELILGLQPRRDVVENSRLGLVVEGLSCSEKTLALSKVLRQRGNFELEYWSKSGKCWSGLKEAIRSSLRSHNIPSQESCYTISTSPEPETALLYLRGRIEETQSGESCLVVADEIRIGRSWLRQELRKSRVSQQIVILDCPGATSLPEWVEDLQLGAERGQCLIAAAAKLSNSEQFSQGLLETLNAADQQAGLPIAGWISRLQVDLAGTDIALHIWLSGAKGVIEVLPGKIGWKGIETTASDVKFCPYRGLQAFCEEDAQFFYGRETLTQQLINELNQRSFIAVIGASGSGKSSVVHAGLIAQLRQGKQLPGSEQWWVKSFRPGASPLQALAWRLVDAGTENEQAYQKMQLEGMLYEGVEGFVRWLRARSEPMVVLVIDQFEELFTLGNVEDNKRFLEIILGALHYAADRFKLVITLRADFISSCLEVPALAQCLQQSSVLVPPYLTKDDYRQAIVMPAEKVGLKIEPQLVEVLLQELNRSAGELPLLQFVLEQLWSHRQAGELTLDAYQHKIGGIQGALERKAQAVYDSLDCQSKDCAKWIFLNLTQLGEGTEDTRRRVLKSELIVEKYPAYLVERTLQALTAAKLVVIGSMLNESVAGRSRGEDATPLESPELMLQRMKQEVTVEVAHEVLIRHWSTLRWWLEENRARLRVQRQIEQAAMLWKQSGKKSDFLLQGVRLGEAEDIYIKYTDELSEDTQLFIDACLQERERQKVELKRRLRQAQTAVGVISILALGALGLGYLAYRQSQTAQMREIQALNSLSENYLLSNKQLEALVTSVKAGRQLRQMMSFANIFAPGVPVDIQNKTRNTLQQALSEIQEYNRLEKHNDAVMSVAFSPDGKIIASASLDNTINLWHRDGKLLSTLKNDSGAVYSLSFSRNGEFIAAAGEDKTIRIWRTRDGKLLKTLKGHNNEVNSVSFSPDSQTIVSASKDKTIKLWRISDGKVIKTLKGDSTSIINVSFSPNGKIIASASTDGIIKLWQSSDGQLLKSIKAHDNWVNCISFSPNGQMIASASSDKTVKLWKVSNGFLIRTLSGHNDIVNSVSFSPDGQTIASGSRDQTIKLWNIYGLELQTFRGHPGDVMAVSFSPDGQTIASASRDNTIKLWHRNLSVVNIQQHSDLVNSVSFSPNGEIIASTSDDRTIQLSRLDGRLLRIMRGHEMGILSASFSPNGQMIASASDDKTIKLWRVRDGLLLKTFIGHTDMVKSVSFSPSGQTIASGSSDNTVKVWRISDGALLRTLRGHSSVVTSVSFSPDGQMIASGSRDKTVKLWRTSDGFLLKTLQGHSNWVTSVSFSPDGQMIASGSEDKTVKLWHRDGKLLSTLQGHGDAIWEVSFSPDSQIIASVSEDKTIKLWHRDGRLLITLRGHTAGVTSVSFSRDGKAIVSGGRDGIVKLIRVENKELQSLLIGACNWLSDYLHSNDKVSKEEQQLCASFQVQKSR